MSNLGFSIESHYSASNAMRRPRSEPFELETTERGLRQEFPTPYRLYFGLTMALALSSAFAFPEQAAMVLHRLGLI